MEKTKDEQRSSYTEVIRYLPKRIAEALDKADNNGEINEIRLRSGGLLSFTAGGENIVCDTVCTPDEVYETVTLLCRGSLHSNEETIKRGYIALPDGLRVGVCGRAAPLGGIRSVGDVTSLCIRLPKIIGGISGVVLRYLAQSGFSGGALIYSAPGVGKTTLLRDIALRLSTPPINRRVALIDERCELFIGAMMKRSLLDVLSGYPKAQGMELAIRNLSPQYIICDEIGTLNEAEAVLEMQGSGVPLIATAHAGSIEELIKRKPIAILHENGIFGSYFGISRMRFSNEYKFKVTKYGDLIDG